MCLAKIFFTFKFNYWFFPNPTHKIKIETTNKWEIITRKIYVELLKMIIIITLGGGIKNLYILLQQLQVGDHN
jgi:L-cystine uptake protein TcyP (sodium:dicarboxylate symporter family)